MDVWISGYLDMWIFEYLDTWIPGYLDIWIFGYLLFWMCGYLDMWIFGFWQKAICCCIPTLGFYVVQPCRSLFFQTTQVPGALQPKTMFPQFLPEQSSTGLGHIAAG